MTGSLKVGVVGIGQRGLQHVRSLTELQSDEMVQLAALADPYADNLDATKINRFVPEYTDNGVQKFSTVREMVDSGSVDAIWFVMPPNQHRGEIEYAAGKGIHIFAEKPQSLFLDEVVRQSEAITSAGVISMCGFQMRHDRGYTDIRNYLEGKWVASMTMIAEGAVESHGVKHTHTEEQGGPSNRVWTANKAWSGMSIVEAGIHQTDIMRYWSDDDVAWVRANYVERPKELQDAEGDNPIYYDVSYGFEKGGMGTIIFTKPARSYYQSRFDCIVWTHGTIKLEDDFADYHFEGEWPPADKPGLEDVRRVISAGPHAEAMGGETTTELAKAFAEGITSGKPELLRNTFQSSINSLAAVLAANVSNDLDGEKIIINEFINDDRYAKYRTRPAGL
jgi:predicted dehydrogenase